MLVLLRPRVTAGQLPDGEIGSVLENAVATARGEPRPEKAAGGGAQPSDSSCEAPCRWLSLDCLGGSVSTVVTPWPGGPHGAPLSWSFTPMMD